MKAQRDARKQVVIMLQAGIIYPQSILYALFTHPYHSLGLIKERERETRHTQQEIAAPRIVQVCMYVCTERLSHHSRSRGPSPETVPPVLTPLRARLRERVPDREPSAKKKKKTPFSLSPLD